MRGRLADGCVLEAVAHNGQAFDGCVYVFGFGQQGLAIDQRLVIGGKHGGDFLQGEISTFRQRYEGELVYHISRKVSLQPSSTQRFYQAYFFVVPQG